MGFFSKRREDVIDLSDYYKKKQERINKETGRDQKITPSVADDDYLSNMAKSSVSQSSSVEERSDYVDLNGSLEDKRKKLAKRLMDMTDKIEELSNQIYHIVQRLDVLEKKIYSRS